MAPTVKRLSTMRETWVRALSWEDPLEKEMAIHSSTIAWKVPWTEEPGRLQSMGSNTTERLHLSLYSTFQQYPFSFEKPSVDVSIGYLFLKGKSWEKTIGIFIDHPSPKLGIFIFSMII